MFEKSMTPQRRPWTNEEKQRALKECACKCASCGTKLNIKSMTMEHVVPISRGGDNVPENLIALCKSCNSSKQNKLYLPIAYYMALNSSKMKVINNYFNNWANENITKEYLVEKPLIVEGYSMDLFPREMIKGYKNGAIAPSLILDFYEITYEESGKILKSFGLSKEDVYRSAVESEKPFSLFGAKPRTSADYSALYVVQYSEEENIISVTEMCHKNEKLTRGLYITLCDLLGELGYKYNIGSILFRSLEEKTSLHMKESVLNCKLHLKHQYGYIPEGKYIYGESNKYHNFMFVIITEIEDIIRESKNTVSK